MSEGIPMQNLKDAGYYLIEDEENPGIYIMIRFRALVGKESHFKIPIAQFTWPDGSVRSVSVTPFTGVLKFTAPLPFNISYRNAVWSADIRYMYT